MNVQCNVSFKEFWNGDESLRYEDSHGVFKYCVVHGCPLAVVKNKLKVLIEANLCTRIRELPSKLDVSHPTVLDHLGQLWNQKSSSNGYYMNWVKILKIIFGKLLCTSFSQQQSIP